MPSPRAGPGWGCTSPLMIRAIRKNLLPAICVIHLCLSSLLRVRKVKAAAELGRSDVGGGENRGSDPLLSKISVENFETLRARNKTVNGKNMTIGDVKF